MGPKYVAMSFHSLNLLFVIIAVLVDIYQVHVNKEKEQKEKYATGARTKDLHQRV